MERETINSYMEYKGYRALISYDNDDEIFTGEVFGIADSLNFIGETPKELKEMFHQSIDNYLDLCQEIGKQPEKEFKGSFNIRIPAALHKQLAFEATRERISLNQYIKDILQSRS